MDIDLLSKMVKELILDRDRLVLPGLGSFMAEVVPSTFSDKGYTINPPYRRLYFRSSPSEGRELIEFYASTNNVSEEVAERIIRDFVAELKQVLHAKKTVVFPGLGRLRETKENNVFFVADETLDIYPAGFGLEPISLKTHQETREEVTAAVAGLKSLLDDSPQPQQEPVEEPQTKSEVVAEPIAEAEPEAMQEAEPQQEEQAPELEESPVEQENPEQTQENEGQVETEETPQQEEAPQREEVPQPKPRGRKLLLAMAIVLGILIVMTVAFAVVGRLYPEWIDQFLYTPEELRILNHRL